MARFEEEVSVKLDDKFSSNANKVSSSLSTLTKAFGTLTAVAGTAFIAIAKKGIDSFLEEEKAVSKLNHALKSVGVSSDAYTKKLIGMADALQRSTSINAESIIDMQRLFIQMGAGSADIERLTKAALDLSVTFGVDATTAARALGNAMRGEVGALSKYGIKLSEAEEKAADLNVVLSKIEGKYGGTSATLLDTYTGKINLLSISFSDVAKSLGALIVESEAWGKTIKFWTDRFNELNEAIKINSSESGKNAIAQIDLASRAAKLRDKIELLKKTIIDENDIRDKNVFRLRELKKELAQVESQQSSLDTQMGRIINTTKKASTETATFARTASKASEDIKTSKEKLVDFVDAFKDLDGTLLGTLKTMTNVATQLKENFNVEIAGSISQATAFLSSMASVGQQVFKVLGGVQSFFDGDVRPVFHKLTDEIDAVNRAMDETERRLDALRGREEQRASGTEVGLTAKELFQSGAMKDIGKIAGAEAMGMQMTIGKGGIVARIEEDGDIKISTSKGVPLGVKRGDTGEWLPENYAFRGPKGIAVLERLLQEAFSSGLSTKFPTQSASTGSTPTSNNRSASTFGASTRSSSMMYSGGSKNINIQAIDAISFTDFMRRSGMQSIRDLTRDEGQLLSSTRSVRRSV